MFQVIAYDETTIVSLTRGKTLSEAVDDLKNLICGGTNQLNMTIPEYLHEQDLTIIDSQHIIKGYIYCLLDDNYPKGLLIIEYLDRRITHIFDHNLKMIGQNKLDENNKNGIDKRQDF